MFKPAKSHAYGSDFLQVPLRNPCHIPRLQTSGAEKILYGYDDVISEDTVIIVEGEIDKLSLNQASALHLVETLIHIP